MKNACDRIKKFGKGLGSDNRYQILQVLFDGPLTVNQIAAEVELSQPAVSQHLTILRSCGMITSRKKGQKVYYSIDLDQTMDVLRHLLTTFGTCERKYSSSKRKRKIP